MFLVRQVAESDLESVLELAKYLNTFNLPHDRSHLQKQIHESVLSFNDPKRPKHQAIYMFVLEDYFQRKILGTSEIFAKHGTVESPHTYLKVLTKTHEDPRLKIKMEHQLLRFEYDTDGPTEIGGLILHPNYRGLPMSLGKFLSYSRFMYMAMFPERFEKYVIAELLPPFNESGSSELWESFGSRFTSLPYEKADRISRTDKDFIRNLFPQEDIYTCLFSEKAREVIGQTGESSRPVKRLLEKIGFSYLEAVDPFDGGPHYGAKLKEITLIKRMKKTKLASSRLESIGNLGLVGFFGKQGFSCLYVHYRVDGKEIELSQDSAGILAREEANSNELYLIAPS